jgi:hypothetical protein
VQAKYMAPEAIKEKKYSEKSDAFSFGVLLWEVRHRTRNTNAGTARTARTFHTVMIHRHSKSNR